MDARTFVRILNKRITDGRQETKKKQNEQRKLDNETTIVSMSSGRHGAVPLCAVVSTPPNSTSSRPTCQLAGFQHTF
jgi:hypothetical protein